MSDSHRLSPVARIVAFGRNVDLRSVSGLDVTASSSPRPRARVGGSTFRLQSSASRRLPERCHGSVLLFRRIYCVFPTHLFCLVGPETHEEEERRRSEPRRDLLGEVLVLRRGSGSQGPRDALTQKIYCLRGDKEVCPGTPRKRVNGRRPRTHYRRIVAYYYFLNRATISLTCGSFIEFHP